MGAWKEFGKGVGKGGAAFGVGYLAQTGLRVAAGAPLSWEGTDPTAPFDPVLYPSAATAANLSALVGSLALSGAGEAMDKSKHPNARTAAKVIGYGILGALGALDSLFAMLPQNALSPIAFEKSSNPGRTDPGPVYKGPPGHIYSRPEIQNPATANVSNLF